MRFVERDLQEWPLPTGDSDGWDILITLGAMLALMAFVYVVELVAERRASREAVPEEAKETVEVD